MRYKKILPFGIIAGIVFIFFYKTFFFGKIPFAGDLLLSQYAPWRHVSYFGYVAGALPSKDQYFDVVRELYPWKTENVRQIKDKTFPLWNPYSFSGSPLLANYQSQVFYPFGILYFLLPQVTAWTILLILQPLLGGFFMYLYARSLRISKGGSIISAIAFNFSSFANVWMEFNTVWHTILWLPLILFFVEKGIEQKKVTLTQQLFFIFAFFSSITAGHPQDFITLFLFFLSYMTVRVATIGFWSLKEKVSLITHYSLLVTISFLLASPQLLPTIELFQNSARVPHDYREIVTKMLFQPWQLGLIAVQDFFGNPATKTYFLPDTYVGKTASIGIVGLFLSLYTLISNKRTWHIKFFIVICIGLLFFTVNTPIAALIHRYPIPILSTGTPTRILFLLCFCLSILAGFGFDLLWNTKKISWKPIVVIGAILGFLWSYAFFHPAIGGLTYSQQSIHTMIKALFISTGFIGLSLLILFLRRYRQIILYGFIFILSVELFYGFIKFNPFVPIGFVFPENPLITFFQAQKNIDRIWGYGTTQIEANFPLQYRLFSTDGTDPLNLKWYNEFIQSSKDGNIAKTFNRTTRSDAQLTSGYGERDLPDNPYRLRVMDALGVKYIIDRTENPKDNTTFSKDRFKEIWHKDDWTVYENLKSAPRYFLTNNVIPYRTTEEFEAIFFSKTFNPTDTVLLQKRDYDKTQIITQPIQNSGDVELLSYTPNEIRFKTSVQTGGNKLLFISDTYDYGWKATIDGNTADMLKANYAFRAIVVPEGSHSINMIYKPYSFTIGMQLMYGGITVLLILTLLQMIKKRQQ
jgi:hypothetical protein